MKDIIKKSDKKRIIITNILFLIIAILLIGRCIDFSFSKNFINGGDTAQALDYEVFINKGIYIWESADSGIISAASLWTTLINIIPFILFKMTGSFEISTNLFWIAIIYLLQLSFYLFYNIFLTKKDAVIATFLTIFSLFFSILFITPINYQIIGFLSFPMMYFLFYSFITKKKFIYCFLYLIIELVSYRSLNILILNNLFIPILFLATSKKNLKIDYKYFIKKYLILEVLTILSLLALLIGTMIYMNYSIDNSILNKYNQESLQISNTYNLNNIYREIINYGFLNNGVDEVTGIQSKDFSILFLKNPILIVYSFILFALFLMSIISNKRNNIFILITLVIILFLTKGINPPFMEVNKLLYSNNLYLLFFRSGAQYFMFFLIPLMILFTFLNLPKNKGVYIVLILILLLNPLISSILYKPINKYWDSNLPEGYNEIKTELKKISNSDRILILPITNHFVGYTSYQDGYTGPDRIYYLSEKNILTKMYAGLTPDNYSKMINDIKGNYSLINEYSNKLGYNYIIVEKDTINSKYYPIDNYRSIIEIIDNSMWQKEFENSEFILFKLKENPFKKRIHILGSSSLVYEKVNPIKYHLYIYNLNKDNIQFLESFSTGWKIYLKKNLSSSWCEPSEFYNNTQTTECEHTQKFFEGEELSYLYKEPIFDNSHQMVYDYANGWTIDSQYIKDNYSSEYYQQNADGSIDIELVMYFKPQSYFYLGLVISLTTFILCIVYLIYDWRKSKNKSLKTDN